MLPQATKYTIRVTGKSTHGALPQEGANAALAGAAVEALPQQRKDLMVVTAVAAYEQPLLRALNASAAKRRLPLRFCHVSFTILEEGEG